LAALGFVLSGAAAGEPRDTPRRLPQAGKRASEMRRHRVEAAMSGAIKRAAALAALILLAGCSTAAPGPQTAVPAALGLAWYPPWTLAKSPAGISLRWYPDTTPAGAAEQVARLHCDSWNKTAALASDTRDGSAEIAQYDCR
jgi:hypothetical protein